MSMRRVPLILVAVAALAVGACSLQPGSTAAPDATSPNATAPSTGGVQATAPAPPTKEPTASPAEYRVSYGWAVPSKLVTVKHPLTAPIAQPPAPPLPYLVAIYVGDHPEASPKYSRISFYFRGAFPSYNFQYAKQVLDEGRGEPISLEGNSYLGIHFVDAQAHDAAGKSTVKTSPKSHVGFHNLTSYGFGGDFEGHVTYGLGIQVAPNSDQVLAIRAGELKKPDGSGDFYYVVHFDVRNG
jgi:hypothetical protein